MMSRRTPILETTASKASKSNRDNDNSSESQYTSFSNIDKIPGKIEFSSQSSQKSQGSQINTIQNKDNSSNIPIKPSEPPKETVLPMPDHTPVMSNYRQNFDEIDYSPTSDGISIQSPVQHARFHDMIFGLID